jgi:hypothetical protein
MCHRLEHIYTWDISDPLNIRQIAYYKMDSPYTGARFHNKQLFLYGDKEMRIMDVLDPAGMKDIARFSFTPFIEKMDVDSDGTLWALTKTGAIGIYDMNGIFTECYPADEKKVEGGRYHPDIKVVDNSVIVANQENGVWIFEKQADRTLKLLKHITNGTELCRGTPIIPVNNGQAIICTSFMGMVMINLKTLKRLKIFKDSKVEFQEGTNSMIEYNPEKREYLTFGSFNDDSKVFLLELSDNGIVCKETISMKGRQYNGRVYGMFIREKLGKFSSISSYLVIMTSGEYFEAHEIIP